MGPYFNSEDNLNKSKHSNTNETDVDKNGRVRFKEEALNLSISKPMPIIQNTTYPNPYENRSLERGNQAFVPLSKLSTNFNPSFLRNNNSGIRNPEQIYSLSDSISDSNNLQLSNKDLSSLDIKEKRESFENLYTQVQPQANRNMSKISSDTFNNLNNQDFNDDSQPVYMNTS